MCDANCLRGITPNSQSYVRTEELTLKALCLFYMVLELCGGGHRGFRLPFYTIFVSLVSLAPCGLGLCDLGHVKPPKRAKRLISPVAISSGENGSEGKLEAATKWDLPFADTCRKWSKTGVECLCLCIHGHGTPGLCHIGVTGDSVEMFPWV